MKELPKELTLFDSLKSDLTQFVSPVSLMKVTDFQSASPAIEAAKEIKEYLKKVQKTRRSLVDPLNERVRVINEYAKGLEKPLLEAEAHLKKELISFEKEQEKLRVEAHAKAQEEQRKREALLLEEQEKKRQALEIKTQMAQEVSHVFGSDPDEEDPYLKEARELEQKLWQEQALQRSQALQAQYDIDQQGIKNTRKIWKCEILDLSLVPKEYLTITLNEKLVLSQARLGITEITGLRLYQETSIAIGSHTYVPSLKGFN